MFNWSHAHNKVSANNQTFFTASLGHMPALLRKSQSIALTDDRCPYRGRAGNITTSLWPPATRERTSWKINCVLFLYFFSYYNDAAKMVRHLGLRIKFWRNGINSQNIRPG